MRIVLLLVLCVGCGPLQYVRKNPIEPPQPIEAPGLTVPVVSDKDCGRFTFNDLSGKWAEEPWIQPGGGIDTIEPGDSHPAVGGVEHLVRCRHVAVPPGWWVVSREARERYPLIRNQLDLWKDYSVRSSDRHQKESEEIAELLKMARRRQLETFAIGSVVGASAVALVILAVVLAGR
jgi:hypothetical protein